MPKSDGFEDELIRQDNKLKLVIGARLLIGSRLFGSRPLPTLVFLGTAATLGEGFVRYGLYQEYKKSVAAGEPDSYSGPLTLPTAEEVTQAANDLADDAKVVYGFFKRVSSHMDSSKTLKKFYPKLEGKSENASASWWKPW